MATILFCVICGDGLPYRNSFGRGRNYPLCKNPACLETYLNLRKSTELPIADKHTDPEAFYKKKELEQYAGFCVRCGKPLRIDVRNGYFRHTKISDCENAPTIRKSPKTAQIKNRRPVFSHQAELKPKPRIYLKPWQDPQSLFCDTEFLETEILHKKIRTGEECKDTS